MCDTFHLPVANFVDNPGFMIGVEAEKQGTIRAGARYIFAVYQGADRKLSRVRLYFTGSFR